MHCMVKIVVFYLGITCPPEHTNATNGNGNCTDTNYFGGECTFTCSEGYGINGIALSVCIDDGNGDGNGTWNSSAPACERGNEYFHLIL